MDRYVMVSFLGASKENLPPEDNDFFAYADAKVAADEQLRQPHDRFPQRADPDHEGTRRERLNHALCVEGFRHHMPETLHTTDSVDLASAPPSPSDRVVR